MRAPVLLLLLLSAGCTPDLPSVPADLAPVASAEAVRIAAWQTPALAVGFSPQEIELILRQSPLGPVPEDPTNRVADDPCAAVLGRALFFDQRLSSSGQVACATCHEFARGTGNGQKLGKGLGTTDRHVPALWNVAYNRWYFWDGRADSLWSQALGPIEHPAEHGFARTDVARLVATAPDLLEAYTAVFGTPVDAADRARFPPGARPEPLRPWLPHHQAWKAMAPADREAVDRVATNAAKAIAAYERLLVSRHAPFDLFVRGLREGDPGGVAALDASAQRGLRTFVGKGRCLICHHGPNFTDGEFHDARLPRRNGVPGDEGRWNGIQALKANPFNVLGAHSDDAAGLWRWKVASLARSPTMHLALKTPTLRNVAVTAPYFHDGTLATLADVVRHYSKLEDAPPLLPEGEDIVKPVHLSEREAADLEAFLRALTDTNLPGELTRAPARPLGDGCAGESPRVN